MMAALLAVVLALVGWSDGNLRPWQPDGQGWCETLAEVMYERESSDGDWVMTPIENVRVYDFQPNEQGGWWTWPEYLVCEGDYNGVRSIPADHLPAAQATRDGQRALSLFAVYRVQWPELWGEPYNFRAGNHLYPPCDLGPSYLYIGKEPNPRAVAEGICANARTEVTS